MKAQLACIAHDKKKNLPQNTNFLHSRQICHVQLLSAMKYEIHRCTVEHLKRKARKHEATDDEIDLQEMDLGDFKTVDSIGDVDGEEGMKQKRKSVFGFT